MFIFIYDCFKILFIPHASLQLIFFEVFYCSIITPLYEHDKVVVQFCQSLSKLNNKLHICSNKLTYLMSRVSLSVHVSWKLSATMCATIPERTFTERARCNINFACTVGIVTHPIINMRIHPIPVKCHACQLAMLRQLH